MSFAPDIIREDLEAYGELHCVYEELEPELELRLGQTTITDDGRIIATTHGETHVYHCDRIAFYYMPEAIHHGHD